MKQRERKEKKNWGKDVSSGKQEEGDLIVGAWSRLKHDSRAGKLQVSSETKNSLLVVPFQNTSSYTCD